MTTVVDTDRGPIRPCLIGDPTLSDGPVGDAPSVRGSLAIVSRKSPCPKTGPPGRTRLRRAEILIIPLRFRLLCSHKPVEFVQV